MSAPISVIIPTLDAAMALPETTEALLEGVTSGLVRELVISDGGSRDGIDVVARGLGAVLVSGSPGRGGQIARGIATAKGPWLLLLHADTHLAPGWAQAAHAHIAGHPGKAGWFRLRFRAEGLAPRLVEAGANLRARYLGLSYGDQGLLVSRDLLESVGGFPQLPLMEDVALARKLRHRLRPLGATALTSADRYLRDGWARRVLMNLSTLTRFYLGASPALLARQYNSRK